MGNPIVSIRFKNNWAESIKIALINVDCGVDDYVNNHHNNDPLEVLANEISPIRSVYINNGGGCKDVGRLLYEVTGVNSLTKVRLVIQIHNSELILGVYSPTDDNSAKISQVVNDIFIAPQPNGSNANFSVSPTPEGIFNIEINN